MEFKNLVRLEAGTIGLMFILGMAANLFVEIPKTYSDSFWGTSGAWIVAIHVILAWVALILAILIFKDAPAQMRVPAIVGLVFVIVAFLGGAAFLFGGANEIFSYTMALGFLFSFGPYVYISARLM